VTISNVFFTLALSCCRREHVQEALQVCPVLEFQLLFDCHVSNGCATQHRTVTAETTVTLAIQHAIASLCRSKCMIVSLHTVTGAVELTDGSCKHNDARSCTDFRFLRG
jgi:hypothetical protein